MFNQVLRDAGRDHNDSSAAGFVNYAPPPSIEAHYP